MPNLNDYLNIVSKNYKPIQKKLSLEEALAMPKYSLGEYGNISYYAKKALESKNIEDIYNYKPVNNDEKKVIDKFIKEVVDFTPVELDHYKVTPEGMKPAKQEVPYAVVRAINAFVEENKDKDVDIGDFYNKLANEHPEWMPVNSSRESGDVLIASYTYLENLYNYERRNRKPDNSEEGVLQAIPYTLEKFGAGVVSGIEDTQTGLQALIAQGASKIAGWMGNEGRADRWEDLAEDYLSRTGYGDEWSDSIEKRYAVHDWTRENVGPIAESAGGLVLPIIVDVATSGVAPTGDIAVTKTTAKFFSKQGLKSFAKKAVTFKPAEITFGLSAAGGAARQGYAISGDVDSALIYGAKTGLAEVYTERLFGGIAGTRFGTTWAKYTGKGKTAGIIKDLLGEGVEEAIMAGVDPVLQRVSGVDKNAKWATGEEVAEAAFHGVLLSTVMKGSTAVLTHGQKKNAIKEINTEIDKINATIENEEDKLTSLPKNATIDEISAKRSELAKVYIEETNMVINAVNSIILNEEDKLTPLSQKATVDEINARRTEVRKVAEAYEYQLAVEIGTNIIKMAKNGTSEATPTDTPAETTSPITAEIIPTAETERINAFIEELSDIQNVKMPAVQVGEVYRYNAGNRTIEILSRNDTETVVKITNADGTSSTATWSNRRADNLNVQDGITLVRKAPISKKTTVGDSTATVKVGDAFETKNGIRLVVKKIGKDVSVLQMYDANGKKIGEPIEYSTEKLGNLLKDKSLRKITSAKDTDLKKGDTFEDKNGNKYVVVARDSENTIVEMFSPDGKSMGKKTFPNEVADRLKTNDLYSDLTKKDFIDNRSFDNVGNRNVKAFQWLFPQLKQYYTPLAQELISDVDNRIEGERGTIGTPGGEVVGNYGIHRDISESLARIKDGTEAAYDEIKDACKRLIKDEGQENVALAKKIEIVIDDMLTDGYLPLTATEEDRVPPNEQYIAEKEAIAREYFGIESTSRKTSGETEEDLPLPKELEQKATKTPSVKVGDVYVADGKTTQNTTSNMIADMNFTDEKSYTKVKDRNNVTGPTVSGHRYLTEQEKKGFIYDENGKIRFKQIDVNYDNSEYREGSFNILTRDKAKTETLNGGIIGKYGVHKKDNGYFGVTLLSLGMDIAAFSTFDEALSFATYTDKVVPFNDISFVRNAERVLTIDATPEFMQYGEQIWTIKKEKAYLQAETTDALDPDDTENVENVTESVESVIKKANSAEAVVNVSYSLENEASDLKSDSNSGMISNIDSQNILNEALSETPLSKVKITEFPPYNISHSEANQIATRWAHNESVQIGDQRIVSYHGSLHVIEKFDSADMKYQIVGRLSSKNYRKIVERVKEYAKLAEGKSTSGMVNDNGERFGTGNRVGRKGPGADDTTIKYRGEDRTVQGMAENKISKQRAEGNTDGGDARNSTDRQTQSGNRKSITGTRLSEVASKATNLSDTTGNEGSAEEIVNVSYSLENEASDLKKTSDGDTIRMKKSEKWHPDLSKQELNELYRIIDRDVHTSTNSITDTANWKMTRINGKSVFAIYSTENVVNPTLLYESKGNQAVLEQNILLDLLEDEENGKGINRKSSFAQRVSEGSWMQNVNNSQNNLRHMGSGRDNQNVGVLQRQSQSHGSPAFRNVLENLFSTQEGNTENRKSITGTRASDVEYLELAKSPEKNRIGLQRIVDDAAKAAGYNYKGYHGTGDVFYEFSKNKRGNNTGAPSSKKAFFFVDNENVAKGYAEDARPEKINELYKKAERLENQAFYNGKYAEAEKAWEEYEAAELEYKGTGVVMPAYLKINNPLIYDFKGSEYREVTYNNLIQEALKNGNDGLIFKNTYDGSNKTHDDLCTVYAVFDSNQVKSANPVPYDDDGNIIPLSERFDTSKNDIRYSIEGENINEQTGDILSDDGSKRQNSTSARKQIKTMDGRSSRYRERRSTAYQRRKLCQTLRTAGNTETKVIHGHKCEVIPSQYYDKRMQKLVDKNRTDGFEETVLITGQAKLPFAKNKNGSSKTARGVFIETASGKKIAIIQYDNEHYMPEQIIDHEKVHKDFNSKRTQKVKNLILNSLSVREKKDVLNRLSKDYDGVIEGNEDAIFEEFVANVLSGMNEYTMQFNDVVKAYWAGDDASIDGFRVSEYAESIDAGGHAGKLDKESVESIDLSSTTEPLEFDFYVKKIRMKVFPPFDETAGSDAHERAERWAKDDSVEVGCRKLASYREHWFIIEKFESLDYGYQIMGSVRSKEVRDFVNEVKRREYEADKTRERAFDGLAGGIETGRSDGLRGYSDDSDTDQHLGKAGGSDELVANESRGQQISVNAERVVEQDSSDKPNVKYSSNRTHIQYSPKGLKLSKNELAKFNSSVSTDYYLPYKTHEGLQYQSCVTDNTHILYVYEDGGFGKYNPVAKINYANINVANAVVKELRNGTTYRITDLVNKIIEVIANRRGSYTVYNAYTKKRISSRSDGSIHKGQSQRNTRGSNAGSSGLTGNERGIGPVNLFPDEHKVVSNENSEYPSGKVKYSLADDGEYDLMDIWDEKIKEYGAIPKGEKPARDIEVPKKISKTEVVSRFARTMMEAGVTPDDAVSEFERRILDGEMTHEVITNESAGKWAKSRIEYLGFEEALNEWDVLSRSGKIGKKELALGMELYNQCITNKDVKNAMKIAAELAAEATRAGQTLQACRMLKEMSPDGQLYFLEKSIQKMNEEFRDKLGDRFKDIELDEQLMERFFTESDSELRDKIYDEICQDIADQIPATLRDKWNSWRYLAMLGNPRTHIRNLTGNAVFVPAVRIKNYIGAVIESAARIDTAERTKSLWKTKEAISFAEKDFKVMAKVLQGENAKYAVTGDIEGKRTIFSWKWLEKLRRKNFDYLEKGDMWFLHLHYVDALARIITARKLDVNNIDTKTLDAIRALAVKEAQEATYRDANALADALNKMQRSAERSKNKGVRAAGVLLEGVMPYKKTPLNIAKQGINYSPYGILKGIYKAAKKLTNGKAYSATDVINDLSKGLTGTGFMLLGMLLASLGILVSGDEENKKKREFNKMVGEQSYALKIGGKSYSIDWMTPSCLPLFVGAELHELTKDDISFADVTSALSTLVEPLLELSVFSGVSGVIESAQYSETNAIFAVISDMFTSYLAQGLPTIGGQLSRIIDPVKREYYYTDKNSNVPQGIQRFIGQSASKIPFASYLFEPSVDEWGRVETYGGLGERIFENVLSPGYYSEENYTAVDKELKELYERTGESSVLPTIQQKYYVADKIYYHMSPEDYTEVKKIRGQKSFEKVKALIESGDYAKMSDEEKVNAIKKCYEDAGKETKEIMLDKVKSRK